MLSDTQCEVIKLKVARETDIPFLKESFEKKIIEKVIETVNPYLEPSMRAMCDSPYVDCLKIALREDIQSDEKRKLISHILRPVLADPLATSMNGILDVALVPEEVEQKVLEGVCRKIIDEFVEWTLGEIDETFSRRLQELRLAASAEEPREAEEE